MVVSAHPEHSQIKRKSYVHATRAELERKLGADHVVYSIRAGVQFCRGRARGHWDANDLETMSAYDRLADLIEAGSAK